LVDWERIYELINIDHLTKTVMEGSTPYDEAQQKLEVAIREYDQSVLHLTARVIAGILKVVR
jgi:hypothetical protein